MRRKKSGALILSDQLVELFKIGWRDVGNGADGKAVLLPGEPVIALGFTGATPVALRLSLFHEDINDVLAASIHQGGDRATPGDIEAPTEQGESIAGKVADGRREIDAAVEPGLDGVLVCGFDVGEMAGLQGAKMGIDERCRYKLRSWEPPRSLQKLPANQHSEKQNRGGG